MPRTPRSPWYWKARRGYYVTISGKRIKLIDGPEGDENLALAVVKLAETESTTVDTTGHIFGPPAVESGSEPGPDRVVSYLDGLGWKPHVNDMPADDGAVFRRLAGTAARMNLPLDDFRHAAGYLFFLRLHNAAPDDLEAFDTVRGLLVGYEIHVLIDYCRRVDWPALFAAVRAGTAVEGTTEYLDFDTARRAADISARILTEVETNHGELFASPFLCGGGSPDERLAAGRGRLARFVGVKGEPRTSLRSLSLMYPVT